MPVTFKSGWRPSPPDVRDKLFAFRPLMASLPDGADLSQPSPGSPFDPAADQKDIGSCGPNTEAKDILYRLIKDTPDVSDDVMPSRLFLYYNTRLLMGTVDQDSGVDNRTMLKALGQYGYCDESLWPYDTSKFTQRPPQAAYDQAASRKLAVLYQSVAQDLNTMKACLAQANKPFIFGFTVYDSMLSDAVGQTGIVPNPTAQDQVAGGHDVLFVGYSDVNRPGVTPGRVWPAKTFKFQNHWRNSDGSLWGDGGYGYISYDYATNSNLSGDFWTVTKVPDTQPTPPPSPTPPPTPTPGPGNIQQVIDAVFAQLERQYARYPMILWALKVAQQLVDNYLQQHNQTLSLQFPSWINPAQVKVILDLVFSALLQQYSGNTLIVLALQLVQNVVDMYLSSLGG
jgi:hypothetical protein